MSAFDNLAAMSPLRIWDGVAARAVQGEEGSIARGDLPRLAERHSRRDLDIRPELYDLIHPRPRREAAE